VVLVQVPLSQEVLLLDLAVVVAEDTTLLLHLEQAEQAAAAQEVAQEQALHLQAELLTQVVAVVVTLGTHSLEQQAVQDLLFLSTPIQER
jgi:hypothetical protein